ncbi:MAG: hypothetical protein FWC98_01535, partial [Bacteroidales bacterium]|nr:hypothetical protein [Bacteroidales bacterium]
PALWCSETLRTGPAFQWTGNNTHDLETPVRGALSWTPRADRTNNYNIVEEVFIELPIDTDGDGRRDLIRATIRRPIESERYADLKLPVFLEISPYRDGTIPIRVIDVTIPMEASPNTMHLTYADDIKSTKPRAADWPWDFAANPTLGIPAARPAVPSQNIVTRGTPVVVNRTIPRDTNVSPELPAIMLGGGHVNVGGMFAQFMFVRGYVVISANTVGNVFSDGFTSSGDICETLASIAVVKWLNGDARGFSCQNAIYQVDATSWSNGNVVMSGTSYNGTLPIAAAATGVEGLKAIIPIAAISNWYYYTRSSGTIVFPGRNNAWHAGFPGEEAFELARLCFSREAVPHTDVDSDRVRATNAATFNAEERQIPSYMRFHAPANHPIFGNEGVQLRNSVETHWENMKNDADFISGNFNRFWDDRNYLATANRITAGIILKHGFNDFNVMPRHFDAFYRAVTELSDAPIKMVLNRTGHASFMTHDAVFDWAHLWLDHFLNGIENNVVENMPNVQIQSSITGAYESFESWPIPGSINRRYFLAPPVAPNVSAAGTLSLAVPSVREFTIQDGKNFWSPSWNTDTCGIELRHDSLRAPLLNQWETALFNVENLDAPSSERLAFVIEITENVRMNGVVVASIEVASDMPWGNITAALVEISGEGRTGRNFTSVETGRGAAAVNTESVRQIVAHNGVDYFDILATTEPVEPFGRNFWVNYKKLTSGHASIQNPNQTDLVTDWAERGLPGIRGRTYMEASATNFIPAFYYQSIVPEPGQFHTYVFAFSAMDWEFRAGDRLAIMVYSTDFRHTMTPSNPPQLTIRTGQNTFVDIPSITGFITR